MLSIKARQAHSIICMCSSTWPTAYKYYSSPHSLAYVNLWTLNEGTSWLSNFCSRSIVLRNFVSFEVLFERYFFLRELFLPLTAWILKDHILGFMTVSLKHPAVLKTHIKARGTDLRLSMRRNTWKTFFISH